MVSEGGYTPPVDDDEKDDGNVTKGSPDYPETGDDWNREMGLPPWDEIREGLEDMVEGSGK